MCQWRRCGKLRVLFELANDACIGPTNQVEMHRRRRWIYRFERHSAAVAHSQLDTIKSHAEHFVLLPHLACGPLILNMQRCLGFINNVDILLSTPRHTSFCWRAMERNAKYGPNISCHSYLGWFSSRRNIFLPGIRKKLEDTGRTRFLLDAFGRYRNKTGK